jgi:hypothetical protein
MHAAGLQKGDRIMSVNGVEIHEMSRQEAAAALKAALEASPTKLLKLVVGRRCRPDVRALLVTPHLALHCIATVTDVDTGFLCLLVFACVA